MSKGTLREDKTCLNCGATVLIRFCPECGQENTETRKSFHYLFTHFIEDLIHYDSGFWKTMKYLFFYPARLTREYLSGRRMAYVPPVKLYIFISFVTFFVLSIISGLETEDSKTNVKLSNSNGKPNASVWATSKNSKETDSLQNSMQKNHSWYGNYKSVKEYDSIQQSLSESKRNSKLVNWFHRKLINIAEHNTLEEAGEKFLYLLKQNIPKALFLYMPIFAFWLWVFHSKKRWMYFDHGIFTLHYFSFLLLTTCIFSLLDTLCSLSNLFLFDIIKALLIVVLIIYPILYFYKAHRRMYYETKWISFFKSSFLIFINSIFILFFVGLLIIYTAINIH